jgi:hypothetical protein
VGVIVRGQDGQQCSQVEVSVDGQSQGQAPLYAIDVSAPLALTLKIPINDQVRDNALRPTLGYVQLRRNVA